jgi:hypothetical protein
MEKRVHTKTGVEVVVLTPPQESDLTKNQGQMKKEKINAAKIKFSQLGFHWFIQREIAAGRILKDDMTPDMIDLYDDLEELQAELGG